MKLGINNQFALFYGGTSLLILVGVILDTLQQIESYLLLRHYDGLMKTLDGSRAEALKWIWFYDISEDTRRDRITPGEQLARERYVG